MMHHQERLIKDNTKETQDETNQDEYNNTVRKTKIHKDPTGHKQKTNNNMLNQFTKQKKRRGERKKKRGGMNKNREPNDNISNQTITARKTARTSTTFQYSHNTLENKKEKKI